MVYPKANIQKDVVFIHVFALDHFLNGKPWVFNIYVSFPQSNWRYFFTNHMIGVCLELEYTPKTMRFV